MEEELFQALAIAHFSNRRLNNDVMILFKCETMEQKKALVARFGTSDWLNGAEPLFWTCPEAHVEYILRGTIPYTIGTEKWRFIFDALEVACLAGHSWACQLRREMLGLRRA